MVVGVTQDPTAAHTEFEGSPSAHFVHALMQFALAVRHRKNVVTVALVVSALLGGLYYLTATRYYGSRAELMVLDVSSDPTSYSMTPNDSWQKTLLPNFQSLIGSEKVVQRALGRLRPEDRIDLKGKPPERWVEAVQKNLSVKNTRKTSILEVSYRSKDPHAAVAIVNAVVDSYLDFMDETYKSTADEVKEVLTRKEADLSRRLAEKEVERLALSREARELSITDHSEILHPLVERAIAANKQLTETRKLRMQLQIALAGIQAAVYRGEDLEACVLALEDVLKADPEALLGLTHVGDLQAKLEHSVIDDRARLATMRKYYSSAHPEIVALEDKIRVTEQSLLEYPARVKQELAARRGPDLTAMVRERLYQVRELEASLEQEFHEAENRAIQINGQLARLQVLDREIDWLHTMREAMLDKIESTNLRHEGQELRASIIGEPKVDKSPVRPRLANTILMVLLFGLGLGLGAVYVLDTLSDRFRSVEEMQALLGVPALAIVPELKTTGATGIDSLQAYAAPNAAETEAFRTLRTALSFADQETRQIVVSSPEPGDGKTTVLANLGVAVAQSGKRVLLIDADLRQPGLTAVLGMRGIEGLSSVIRGEDDIVRMAKAHIRASELDGLDILPSGPRPANPAELLGSQRLSELLAWAEATYDQVLIDSPPTLATTDAAVIGRLVNGAVLVVNPAKNRRRPVMRSVAGFAQMRIPLVGVVVNRIDFTKDGYYGYGGYYACQRTYGGETEEPETNAAVAIEEDGLIREAPDHPARKSPFPPGGVVPRRVA